MPCGKVDQSLLAKCLSVKWLLTKSRQTQIFASQHLIKKRLPFEKDDFKALAAGSHSSLSRVIFEIKNFLYIQVNGVAYCCFTVGFESPVLLRLCDTLIGLLTQNQTEKVFYHLLSLSPSMM
jgi:hypothetical protein